MAGIGFRFRKMVHEGTYTGEIKGYIFASLFAAGPWIMTMVIIGVLTGVASPEVQDYDLTVFRATITYVYAVSLIVVGLFHLPLTRYLADRLFEENLPGYFSAYMGAIVVTIILALIPATIFLHFNTGSILYRLFSLMIFLVVSLIWIAMVFLSALREYKFIVFTFVIGSLASIVISLWLKARWGLEGYLLGYFLGQLFIFAGMSAQMFSEFSNYKGMSLAFWKYMYRYRLLIISGVGYNAGIWMDKFVIWFSYDKAEVYYGNLQVYGLYDTAVFISYLTVIPALGYFYSRIETSFYEVYRQYFNCIFMKKPLSHLEEIRDRIVYMVDVSVLNLFKNQGVLTLLCIVWSTWLVSLFHGGPESVAIFRWALIGIFFQILFLFCSIFMMYFEFYYELAIVNTTFMILNGVLTWIVIHHTNLNMAAGYSVSCLIVFLMSYVMLKFKLKNLIYITFTTQDIVLPENRDVNLSINEVMQEYDLFAHDKLFKRIDSGRAEIDDSGEGTQSTA